MHFMVYGCSIFKSCFKDILQNGCEYSLQQFFHQIFIHMLAFLLPLFADGLGLFFIRNGERQVDQISLFFFYPAPDGDFSSTISWALSYSFRSRYL